MRLSQEEIALAAKYDNILCDYMREIGEDITMDLAPPRSTIITIRCCEDYGMRPLDRAPHLHAFLRTGARVRLLGERSRQLPYAV